MCVHARNLNIFLSPSDPVNISEKTLFPRFFVCVRARIYCSSLYTCSIIFIFSSLPLLRSTGSFVFRVDVKRCVRRSCFANVT